MLRFVSLVWFVSWLVLYSQDSVRNLVLGGDFEWLGRTPPYKKMSGMYIRFVYPWDSLEFDTCFMFGGGFFRYDSARSGVALSFFMGKVTRYGKERGEGVVFVCLPLREALAEGRVYRVRFYVKASYSSYYLTEYVGLRFYKECKELPGWLYEALEPWSVADVRADTIIGCRDWELVEGEYCARGGERYVVMGIWLPEDDRVLRSALIRYQLKGIDMYWGRRTRRIRRKLFRRMMVRNRMFRAVKRGMQVKCDMNASAYREYYGSDPPLKGWIMYKKSVIYFFDDVEVVPTDRRCGRGK